MREGTEERRAVCDAKKNREELEINYINKIDA